jgi:hypothetical protein
MEIQPENIFKGREALCVQGLQSYYCCDLCVWFFVISIEKLQILYPKQPSAFTSSELLREVKDKLSGITLSGIACEAGIQGGPKSINIPGIATGTCLNWIVMGQCMLPKCKHNHPSSLDANMAATALYHALERGMKRLMETGTRPRFWQGSV